MYRVAGQRWIFTPNDGPARRAVPLLRGESDSNTILVAVVAIRIVGQTEFSNGF